MDKEDLLLNKLQLLKYQKTKPNHVYLIYMYKEDLALNNLQRLIYHKNSTKPNPCIGCNKRLIFNWSTADLNSEYFLLDLTRLKKISLPYYLPIAVGIRDGLMIFPGYLCEMKLK